MPDPRDAKAAQIQGSIRRVLYEDWNPIGVGSLPPDEHDRYIAPVYRILAGTRSEQELIECLCRIEWDDIGMPCGSPEKLKPIARKLLALDIRL